MTATCAAACIAVMACGATAAPAAAQQHEPALRLSGGTVIPGVLGQADVGRYLQIFDLQERGRLADAAALIADLDSRVLMGYVAAQKYLHPTAHRSSFAELRDWLADYADLPQADRIHRLARRRQPDGAADPRPPTRHAPPPVYEIETVAAPAVAGRSRLSRDQRRAVAQLRSLIADRVGRGWPTGAREALDAEPAASWMSAGERLDAARLIARGYYRAGMNREALDEANLAWMSDTGARPGGVALVHWWGGLAAWRLGDMGQAQRHFAALGDSTDVSQWVISAAAYWAARASLAGRQPHQVNYWLSVGAAYPYTFYGLLARRALGYDLDYDWSPPPLRPAMVALLGNQPAGRRAVALMQLGMMKEAEVELVNLAGNQRDLATTVMALAARADMPYLTRRLSGADRSVLPSAAAMYPVPPWTPQGGFALDRALLYAVMRQESGFNERAESRAGAAGLMQLLPSTASFITGDRSLRNARRERLFDPSYNIHLGQAYLTALLRHAAVGNDLFKLAVAYNAGPGNLQAWLDEIGDTSDSLLFIESLPSRETRIFVERVLANFWIYRNRLGQPTPSLTAAASGGWPALIALDDVARPATARADVAAGPLPDHVRP